MKRLAVVLVVCLVCSACGDKMKKKVTYPVGGTVTVDGKPASGLQISCHDVKGIDSEDPTVSGGSTDAAGHFELNTYDKGDGVPEGEYTLTFKWGKLDPISRGYSGDQLNGKYTDPKKSETKFKAGPDDLNDEGKIDLGTIDLKTK